MAQVFFNSGLTLMLNQVYASGITGNYNGNLYVGLFTNASGSTVPLGTAVLGTTNTTSYVVEQTTNTTGYSRKLVTFASPTAATTYTADFSTTLGATGATGSWVVTVASTSSMAVGMSIVVGTESVKTITGISGTTVTLSSTLAAQQANGATVTYGDAVSGVKAVGNTVTFTATGTWTAVNGFFIATGPTYNAGTLLYAANFADGSSPAPNANDTLSVTPTWLMSN